VPVVTNGGGAHRLDNAHTVLEFDSEGRLARWVGLRDGQTTGVAAGVRQDYMVYRTDQGGPYCLVEQHVAAPLPGPASSVHVAGPLFAETILSRQWGDPAFAAAGHPPLLVMRHRLTTGTTLDHVVRLEHRVPVLPLNYELISRLATDLSTGGLLHHDDSALELFVQADDSSLPISGRYHAMVQSVVIRDEGDGPPCNNSTATGSVAADHRGRGGCGQVTSPLQEQPQRVHGPQPRRQLTVLSGHTKGVASLAAGELEYMLARRINGTDDQGPWPLNETTPLVIPMGLMMGAVTQSEPLRLATALQLENPPRVLYGQGTAARPTGSPLQALPEGVAMTHLHVRMGSDEDERVDRGSVQELIVRLQSTNEIGQGPVTVDLSALFAPLAVTGCTETTLTLQQPRSQSRRLVWLPQTGGPVTDAAAVGGCNQVQLMPLDIRTFVLSLRPL